MVFPFFSIILPIYNVEKYLNRCIESVLNQNFSDYEIILVDDGATDSCPQICDYYTNKYSFIKTIHKENGGLSSARNAGMEMAQGKYLLFFDSDDWIEEDALFLIYQSLIENEVDVIKFNYFRHIEKDIPERCIVREGIYQTKDELEFLRNIAFYNTRKYCMSAWLHGYNRKFLIDKKLRFISEREVGSEDYLFNFEVLLKANSVRVMEECLYHYDLREGSLTQRYRNTLPEQYTKLYRELKKYLEDNNLLDQYQSRLCYFYIWGLMYACCLVNEYNITENHSIREGRKRIKEYLSFPDVKLAIKLSEKRNLNLKQWVQLYAMKFKFEPLFYYLFVVKPRRST